MFKDFSSISQYVLLAFNSILRNTSPLPECRVLPGDLAWPDRHDWDALNATVNGRLIETVPLGRPCHHPNYNEEECQAVRKSWRRPHVQYASYLTTRKHSYL